MANSNNKIIDVSLDQSRYQIHLGNGVLSNLVDLIKVKTNNRKVMIVGDEYLQPMISEKIVEPLTKAGFSLNFHFLQGGKHSKNISEVMKVYGVLETEDYARDSVLIAVGGGVVGDLAGFVASTYLRGIYLVHIPTTLMAMVDSSIGGKVAINFRKTINAIGNYYHPIINFMDMDILATLPYRDHQSGLAEVIKCGLIADHSLLSFMQKEALGIQKVSPEPMMHCIERAINIKIDHVTGDVREGGKRLLLNYGHTLGHAVEISSATETGESYRHGEGVSIGMMGAALIAREYYNQDNSVFDFHSSILNCYGLPVSVDTATIGFDRLNLLRDCIRNVQKDKKRKDNHLRFVLIPQIGSAEVCSDVSLELVEKTLEQIIK